MFRIDNQKGYLSRSFRHGLAESSHRDVNAWNERSPETAGFTLYFVSQIFGDMKSLSHPCDWIPPLPG